MDHGEDRLRGYLLARLATMRLVTAPIPDLPGPQRLLSTAATARRCGGPDGHECIREVGKTWAKDFNGVLDEVDHIRSGRPTVIRLVNAANGFAIDKGLAVAAPKGFATTGDDLIFKLLTQAQCSAAQTHSAVGVDARPRITGPGDDSDENSDASMRGVAQALMETGLRELTATGHG